jgi:uncharacterized protein YlxW (UPF0749 family)
VTGQRSPQQRAAEEKAAEQDAEQDVEQDVADESTPGGTERNLPDQVTMGLLPYLNAHSLDEDYAIAARRRAGGGEPRKRRPIGIFGAFVLAMFALLALTAAVQTSRNSATDERERRELIAQIAARKDALTEDRTLIEQLRRETESLETARLLDDNTSNGVFGRLRLLGMRNGNVPVQGPGVRVRVDNAPGAAEDARRRVLDTDLQHLANGLWEAGAEAIAINNQRLTNLSAIRHAGSAITVNFRSLSPPYTVEAIGPDSMPARFGDTTSGQTWLDLQQQVGLEFSMKAVASLTLPAEPVRDLRFAKPLEKSEKRLP